ncbi:hypothetical protein A0J48_025915 [Sphaerospermopsis aphanizomenoides BCCUSP55]|uniref:hypothetical protein n=1 Tax=Sphaerospermopsis aphanizomenoides TaxID=459663 RepID=UPI00190756CE|nr:hypothetical protein [Sphaerospermopsis aphanizomenoides]MBK1990904.1 hypothetical protein [Sphaerospermopsis aphanizomenoides BCCUSP55]
MNRQLKPWAVFRIDTPSNSFIARFKKRDDADEYMKLLKANTLYEFEVVFDN